MPKLGGGPSPGIRADALIPTSPASGARWFGGAGSLGCPRLVIPGRASTAATAQDRAPRMIGEGCPGHVRLMLLLPRIADAVRSWDLVDRMVQPGVPFGRYLRPLRLTVIHDPTLFAAGSPTATPQGPIALLAIVTVAEAVGADQLTP